MLSCPVLSPPASSAPTADSQYSFLKKLTEPQGKSLRLCACYYPRESSWSLLSYPFVKSTACCSSVAQSCPILCSPMDCNTPGFPVLHYLQEFAQTHVHRVSDATQPSHPLSSPSPPTFNLSQHQGLFH